MQLFSGQFYKNKKIKDDSISKSSLGSITFMEEQVHFCSIVFKPRQASN